MNGQDIGGTIRSEWDFATIRSAMGSMRDSRFMGMENGDDWDEIPEDGYEDGPAESFDSTASVRGSDVPNAYPVRHPPPGKLGLGQLQDAAHSTVLIKVRYLVWIMLPCLLNNS